MVASIFKVKLQLAVVALWALPAMAHSAQAELPEVPSAIEYASVSDAREALKAKPGVVFSAMNGWDIATDKAVRTIWSFSPADYPAYPAVVKRQVVQDAGKVFIKMSVHCEASKVVCDDLVRTFADMTGLELPR